MSVAVSRAGRPHVVALIEFEKDGESQLVDEFFAACADFHYREMAALSRALCVNIRTIENWKYKISFPGWCTALQVIHWVEKGKPMELRSPHETVNMF